jgi:hypothetical protein
LFPSAGSLSTGSYTGRQSVCIVLSVETTKRCPYCAEEILAAAIKCKHCASALIKSVPAYDPIIGPPLVSGAAARPQKSIWASPPGRGVWILGLMMALFLTVRSCGFFEKSNPNNTTSDATPETTPAVTKLPELTSVIETNGVVVTVKNDDEFSWQDCDAIINGGFSGFDLQFGDVSPSESVSLPTRQFANGSERFNPNSTKVLSIVVACKTRNGEQYASAYYE